MRSDGFLPEGGALDHDDKTCHDIDDEDDEDESGKIFGKSRDDDDNV